MIYFDYGATTPIDDEVLDAYIKTQKQFFANTSSSHKLGLQSNYMLEKATQEIKDTLGLSDHNIVYTSNATEANNLGIYGVVHQYPNTSQKKWRVFTTKIEHPSVFEVFHHLEEEGYDVIYLDVDEQGIVNIQQLQSQINKDTILVSIMWVNNIIGSIQPIQEILDILKAYPKATFHMDAVQGLCKVVPNFPLSQVDMFTMSTHKIYGPKGIGFLAYRKSIALNKRLYGSQTQFGIKPGTIDLALVVATCKALKIYYPSTQEHSATVAKMNQYLLEQLKSIEGIFINSPIQAVPFIVSISLPSVNGETIVHQLESKEIYVSTGSACNAKTKKPEKTIYAITHQLDRALSTIRISLSHLTTISELDMLIATLKEICHV
ncbi:MAG: cysteine desulfurase family protein [Bacilli bacterium]|nr:cysteine desulfurase family protein [Bacilli bacterium]